MEEIQSKIEDQDDHKKNKEIQTEVTLKTYTNFLFLKEGNKILFTITIILFLVSEGINMAYLRFLAKH